MKELTTCLTFISKEEIIMNFTNLLNQIYEENGIETISQEVICVKPIIELDTEEEKLLLEGDGQSNPNEYKQINSSTGLAVNYFKILESIGNIEELVFEDKVAIPLKSRGGRKANLDVSYKRDGKLFYVESKFLEPYYSNNEKNRESYFKPEKYPVPEKDKSVWYELFVEAQSYKYYNFSQLCRHLLAIWRKHEHDSTSIVLQSITWLMPNTFIERMESDEDKKNFRDRRNKFEEEAKKCQSYINSFLKTIGWKNMTFESLYYNDIIDDISSSPKYTEFKKRYLL